MGCQVVMIERLYIVQQSSPYCLEYDTNFAPIQGSMERIAEQYTTSQSSPLGRAIYAKYLLASKYIHRMQNAVLGEHILNELHDTIINMTWTRARPSEPM